MNEKHFSLGDILQDEEYPADISECVIVKISEENKNYITALLDTDGDILFGYIPFACESMKKVIGHSGTVANVYKVFKEQLSIELNRELSSRGKVYNPIG